MFFLEKLRLGRREPQVFPITNFEEDEFWNRGKKDEEKRARIRQQKIELCLRNTNSIAQKFVLTRLLAEKARSPFLCQKKVEQDKDNLVDPVEPLKWHFRVLPCRQYRHDIIAFAHR